MPAPLSEITAILQEIFPGNQNLGPNTRFEDLTGWNPADLVSAVAEAECRYDVQFALPEIDRLDTIGDLLRVIEAKRGLAPA